MSSGADVEVTITSIEPYSAFDLSEADRERVCRALAAVIDRRADRDGPGRAGSDPFVDTRARVAAVDGRLQLGVGDHDRIRTALRGQDDCSELYHRFVDAEPSCAAGCGESAFRQIHIDGGSPILLCTGCIEYLNQGRRLDALLGRFDATISRHDDIETHYQERTGFDSPLTHRHQTTLADHRFTN